MIISEEKMICHLDTCTLHYESVGAGKPILFLPGWSLDYRVDHASYEPIFSKREGWRRIYLDFPGHGRSPAAEGITCQDDFLDATLAFIDQVFPGERFLVSGTSAGALVARGIIQRRAEMVDGLLLRVPLIIADDAKRTVPPFRVLIRDDDFMATLPEEQAAELAEAPVQTQAHAEAVGQIWRELVGPAWELMDEAYLEAIRSDPARYGFTFDVDALGEPFLAPSLFICGRQDTTVGYVDAWNILENFPRATFAVLDRAGHAIPVGDSALFEALVNEWLDRVEEYQQ